MIPAKRVRALVPALAAVALAAGCATTSKPTFRADYDRTADFAAYRTYAYVTPVGTDKAGYSSLVTQHFKNAIDAEMGARGYRKVDADPDLLVNFNANAQEKTDIRSTPQPTMSVGMGYYGYRGGLYGSFPVYGGGTDVSTVTYKVGTLNVDVVDAKRKQLVWEGVAEGKLSKEAMANPEAAIRSVIGQLYQQFPGRAAPAQ